MTTYYLQSIVILCHLAGKIIHISDEFKREEIKLERAKRRNLVFRELRVIF